MENARLFYILIGASSLLAGFLFRLPKLDQGRKLLYSLVTLALLIGGIILAIRATDWVKIPIFIALYLLCFWLSTIISRLIRPEPPAQPPPEPDQPRAKIPPPPPKEKRKHRSKKKK